MPRKTDYVYIYLDRRLQPLLEKLLEHQDIRSGLLEYGFKYDAQGVAKYAVYKLLRDKNMFKQEPTLMMDSEKAERLHKKEEKG